MSIETQYVRYQLPDLDRAEAFLVDFGLVRVHRDEDRLFMGATGPAPFSYEASLGEEPRFLGAGLAIGGGEELERLSAMPGSSPVEDIDAPGGGKRVRMTMRDGFEIDAVWGWERDEDIGRPAHPRNVPESKQRINAPIRIGGSIPPVGRMCHFVLKVTDLEEAVTWLHERFGMIPSDHLAAVDDEEQIVGSFLRDDRGTDVVDHHCMLVLRGDQAGVHHCAFEVVDLDALMASHDHLVKQGYNLECGVGRHLLGSQIFDYWNDPFGFRIEHYADGDVVNDEHRPQVYAVTAEETTQWGAVPPDAFFE